MEGTGLPVANRQHVAKASCIGAFHSAGKKLETDHALHFVKTVFPPGIHWLLGAGFGDSDNFVWR